MFVVSFTDGSIHGDAKNLTLEMKLQNHSDFWFADRPVRRAGRLDTTALIKNWTKVFKSDPPNAVLVVESNQDEAVPLKLESPVLTGGTVTFQASRLSNIPKHSALEGHKEASSMPSDFEHASLFIDDGGLMQIIAYGAQDVY